MRRAVAAGAVVALIGGAARASTSEAQIRCRSATPIDSTAPIGRAVPIAKTLWLGIYPFQKGYPTKAIVMAQRTFQRAVMFRAWNCANGMPLRLWYREGNPGSVPMSINRLRNTGDIHVRFGQWPASAMRTGYFMFWRNDLWRVVAYQRGRQIGTAIVRSAPM
jgi:hypothetical protein